MPRLEHADFTYELDGATIVFNVSADVGFTESELNSEWIIEITVMEKDVVADDVVFIKSLALAAHKLSEKHTFAISVPRDMATTEPGDEELYCILRLFDSANSAEPQATAHTSVERIDI